MNTTAPPDTTGGAHFPTNTLTNNDAIPLTPNVAQQHSRLGQQPPITYEKNTRPAPATLAPAA